MAVVPLAVEGVLARVAAIAHGIGVVAAALSNFGDDWQLFRDASNGGAAGVPNEVGDLAKDIKGWLGNDAKVITNNSGDKIFISNDGTRRVRFDINNTSPHNNPHGHVEEFIDGQWVKSGPIYPSGVPNN